MTIYIENSRQAEERSKQKMRLREVVIQFHKEALNDDYDKAEHYASLKTEEADLLLVTIRELEAALIDWQERWPDEHDETDCDGDCPRDHDAEARDTVRETIWEQQRDEAA